MKFKSSLLFIALNLALCFIFASSAFTSAHAEKEKQISNQFKNKWAVLVGVENFKEKRLNKGIRLDDAAVELKDMLVDKYNFDAEGVFLLTNEEATRGCVKGAIGEG